MTIQEAYEARPRLWWLYTLVVLIVAALLGWSGSAVVFKGFATKGVEVAKGVWNGLTHPDTALLFNLTTDGVPYQLMQTVAIAVLGTLIGGILAIPFSFLASDKIVLAILLGDLRSARAEHQHIPRRERQTARGRRCGDRDGRFCGIEDLAGLVGQCGADGLLPPLDAAQLAPRPCIRPALPRAMVGGNGIRK